MRYGWAVCPRRLVRHVFSRRAQQHVSTKSRARNALSRKLKQDN
jgi:hypothetical protein